MGIKLATLKKQVDKYEKLWDEGLEIAERLKLYQPRFTKAKLPKNTKELQHMINQAFTRGYCYNKVYKNE
jgi:hypothetical protein